MSISDYIGEATDYDKKQALEEKKPKSWCKSVSAFANGTGGSLIFGVADDDTIIGLQNPKHDSEIISEKIKTHLDPIPEFNLRFVTEDDKTLIILDILPGEDTPYYVNIGSSLEAFIRVGNQSVLAEATELRRLVLRGKHTSFDSLRSGYRYEDYAFSKLRERYKVWTGTSLTEKAIDSFGIKETDGTLTNAGALLADECPIRYSRLFCTHWNGKDKTGGLVDAIDSAEYSGSLISLLDEGMAFVKRNMRTMWKKTPSSRIEMPDYCERSVFEALVNALIHRDYLILGSEVHIDIFDDRMTIYSPG
ncbi:MAG: putative DNA binding domain-containing protein, partial [Lachnospiraceae bacterium]|nr:putative DNA binding domain-containing protein [Lachnospiraceae bacterium]